MGFTTVNEVPVELLVPCEKPGRVESVFYKTKAYGNDERELLKQALVYLPYNYDENKKYPVFYLLHGGGQNEVYWMGKHFKNRLMVDNMIANGESKEVIIVMPSIYPRDKELKFEEAGYLPKVFWEEARNDLIPAVEKKYSTYASGDVSLESLIASRDYRAFGGLSMGSMTTYSSAVLHMLDLFAWIAPYSGCAGPKCDVKAEAEKLSEAINVTFKDYDIKYMFCCNGTEDIAHDEHVNIMAELLKKTDKLTEGENYEFVDKPGHKHSSAAWRVDLYNTLTRFFK